MGRPRKSLLKKHEVEVAKRKRQCKNSKSEIQKGESCIVVWDDQFKKATYSKEIGLKMIADARSTLKRLEEILNESQM